jgi:SAM-dependent methyltransferase
MNLYGLLDSPIVFKASQALLAPGRRRRLTKLLAQLLQEINPGQLVLDIGCGPNSLLAMIGIQPIGSDISELYMRSYARNVRSLAVVNSADALPFTSGCFDSVWSFALIHHLPDEVAQNSLQEMVRVCRPGGHVIILDAVMPRSAWIRPIPYVIRRLDRGKFVRKHDDLCRLLDRCLPSPKTIRVTTTDNGLEAIWSWAKIGEVSTK